MKKQNKYVLKNKQVLKLFRFITVFSIKRRGGKTSYYLFGLPIWKVRYIDNENLIKYYLFNIPILRFYYVSTPSATDIIMSKQAEIAATQQKLTEIPKIIDNLYLQFTKNAEQLQNIEDRIKVYHAETLERFDNLPKKEK